MTNTLPLDQWHRDRGARMVPFAGYEMPIQYEGIIAEHKWVREHAGLFDVSHMGQLLLSGPDVEEIARALETVLPGDILGLKPGRMRYSMLLDEHGGIIDDLIVMHEGNQIGMVVNGAVKAGDIVYLRKNLPETIKLTHFQDHGLLALQGPKAADTLVRLVPEAGNLSFMQAMPGEWRGHSIGASRSGYTGEDGFEISLPNDALAPFCDELCAMDEVKPIGLGARDSLRLEAGLPLYGHDLDTETTPVMADLGFAIGKRRREEGGFAGAERILGELTDGAPVKRVGFFVEGRQPVREGAPLLDDEGNVIGKITSGGFSPSLERPIAMGYLATHLSDEGTVVKAEQRGKLFDLTVTPMPFVPHRYHRKTKQGA